MAEVSCWPLCKICRAPGPEVCRATYYSERNDRRDEERADLEDAARAVAFASRPTGRYSTNAARGWDSNGLWGYVEPDPAREAS